MAGTRATALSVGLRMAPAAESQAGWPVLKSGGAPSAWDPAESGGRLRQVTSLIPVLSQQLQSPRPRGSSQTARRCPPAGPWGGGGRVGCRRRLPPPVRWMGHSVADCVLDLLSVCPLVRFGTASCDIC